MPKFLPSLLIVLVGALIGLWFLFVSAARLTGSPIGYWWPNVGSIPQDRLFDIARSTVTAAGVLAGLFAIVYAYRKQRVEEAAGHRADEEGLSKRYEEAASQLGHDKPAVRLAGVYAMARLADDWPEHRQTCVNVLSAYIRMAWDTEDKSEAEVRSSIFSVIGEHVEPNVESTSWSGLEFDFRRAILPDLSIAVAVFRKRPLFSGAEFTRKALFGGIFFLDGADFNRVRISGSLTFEGVTVTNDSLMLNNADVLHNASLAVRFRELGPGATADLVSVKVSGGRFSVVVPYPSQEQGKIDASYLRVESGSVTISAPRSRKGEDFGQLLPVDIQGWTIERGTMRADQRLMESDRTRWGAEKIADGVDFNVFDFDEELPPILPEQLDGGAI